MRSNFGRSWLVLSALALTCGVANAGQFVCANDGSVHYKDVVAVDEAGLPGLIWVGMHNPAKTAAYLLDLQGGWDAYNGGLLSPAGRYDNGLPGTLVIDVALPPGSTPGTTDAYVGWQIYEGHGVLTQKSIQQVAQRRQALDAIKPSRVAAGTWPASYDSDDQIKWSLVQKDMTDNGKYVLAMTVPAINCAPMDGGGNH
jgi:hypothetical protein